MNWKNINVNKFFILSLFFGFITGIKEHSVLWGLLILVLGFVIFNLMDWMRAPLGAAR